MDARQQFAHAERFGDVIVRAEIKAHHLVDLLAFGREHENGCGDFLRAEFPADVVAAFAGQHHVQHDEGGPMFRDGIDGLVAAIADNDLKAVALHHFLQTQQDVRIVFDNENFCFHSCQFVVEIGAAGRRSVKQLPPPSRGWQTTSPPCARAICRASVRPSPDP